MAVGQGRGAAQRTSKLSKRTPLPNPLPARASRGEGARILAAAVGCQARPHHGPLPWGPWGEGEGFASVSRWDENRF